ncbi:MAG: hypothetical protein RL230_1845, partial [Pseudomonadota bacterium]
LRRNPGQSVNLAHLFWHTPRALAPLLLKEATRCSPGGFLRGAVGAGGEKPLQSLRETSAHAPIPRKQGSGMSH